MGSLSRYALIALLSGGSFNTVNIFYLHHHLECPVGEP